MEAAVAGQGVALARRTIAQHWLSAGLLRRLFELEAESPHAYWLLYEQINLARPEVRTFIEWLRETVRDAGQGTPLSDVQPAPAANSARGRQG
jgi:DNA-binding transcriptional LysR family regulator